MDPTHTAPKLTSTPSPKTRAKRYTVRDKHEVFFRPGDENAREQKQKKQKRKPKRQKPVIWTNNERHGPSNTNANIMGNKQQQQSTHQQ